MGLSQRYDFLIVGAGSAGAVLASRLTEDPGTSVLLIEAGPDYPDSASLPNDIKDGTNVFGYSKGPHNWGFRAIANAHQAAPTLIPRGKVVGGSSAINAEIFLRGMPEDFAAWASWGNDEWAFDKVLPYFIKLETDLDCRDQFHGSTGPTPVRRYKREEWTAHARAFYDACLSLKFEEHPDQNHPQNTGIGPKPNNNRDGVRMSTALCYLAAARARKNLTVLPDTLVRRVLFEGNRAVALEVETGGNVSRIGGGQVILSAGAIGTPHLLLRSGVGPAEDLESLGVPVVADVPGVGKNLRDHPQVWVVFELATPAPSRFVAQVQVGLRCTAPDSKTPNDLILHPLELSAEYKPPTVSLSPNANYFGIVCCLQSPATAGQLTLESGDPTTPPKLDYRYLQSAWDLRRMRYAVRLAVELGRQDSFRGLIRSRPYPSEDILRTDAGLDAWILSAACTQQASSATCKMGPSSDPLAVVDQRGFPHAVEGLRIVDASIMPDVPRANTNATTIMMAERVADWIKSGR